MARVAFVWALFAVVVLVGWDALHPAAAQTATTTAAADGEFLWKRDCASCHGATGVGTAWGPTIVGEGPAGVSLVLTTGRMPLAADARGSEPRGFSNVEVRRGSVQYTTAEIDALVAYSRTILDGPDVPTVDLAGADLSRGQQLFQANCAACHTSGGRGGALTTGQVAVSLVDATPTQVVEAMRVGLGTMPVFDRGEIDEESAADVAAYVDYLRSPVTPLGLSLGFIGPVAEGFVAWLVGLVGLLVAVRWIGIRS